MTFGATLKNAGKKALGGGLPGLVAMVLQVFMLMWMRTLINYQYRHGGGLADAAEKLWSEGGIGRFYQGLGPALLQGPISRFGDTASNEGMKALLANSGLSVGLITMAASFTAATWRIFITPIDTLKTMLQVEGPAGLQMLTKKIAENGMMSMYDGAVGTWVATFVGHYPWFATYNFLDKRVPKAEGRMKLLRSAFIGFWSAMVSDIVSNGIRVVKTYVQTSATQVGYVEAVQTILASDGISGLLFRGLGIKLASNGLSSILFTVLWKIFMEMWQGKKTEERKRD